jgi:hypothetical protein
MNRLAQSCILAIMSLSFQPPALAESKAYWSNDAITIERPDNTDQATLVLVSEDGVAHYLHFAADEAIRLDGVSLDQLGLNDGRWTYEVRFRPILSESSPEEPEELRAQGLAISPARQIPPLSGTLTKLEGRLLGSVQEAPESIASDSDSSSRDQVIADDLIVQGSICAGFDCINGENFGFDSLRIKENNTRLTFIDTSSSAGFAAGDWQLRANDSENGGADHFSIDWLGTTAASGGSLVSTPFRVDGGAPNNAMRIISSGNVGLGTATPVLDLHLASGNTPAIRLEQSSASGFSPQTWDISGNEANFFVRDVTNSSRLPFRIRPGAPTSSIDINGAGNVGIGTASPAARLHVSNGDLRVDGAIYQLSSRALKTDFIQIEPGRLLAGLASLDLGLWRYRDHADGASHFGPAAEDFFALFGLGHGADSIAVADLAGVALGASQALQQQLEQKNSEIASLENEVDQLNQRLLRLEQLIEDQLAGQGNQ